MRNTEEDGSEYIGWVRKVPSDELKGYAFKVVPRKKSKGFIVEWSIEDAKGKIEFTVKRKRFEIKLGDKDIQFCKEAVCWLVDKFYDTHNGMDFKTLLEDKGETNKLFEGYRDHLEVESMCRSNGVILYWTRKGYGFGGMYISITPSNRFDIDDECMDGDFCKELLCQAIDQAKILKEETNG